MARNLIEYARTGMVALGKAAGTKPPALLGPKVQPWAWHLSPLPKTRDALKLYNSNPWAHAIISKISGSCARVKWYVEDGDTRIDNHPVLDFINSGSEYLTGMQSRAVTTAHIDLCGESFWLIGRDEAGVPASFLPCPPQWVLDVAQVPGQSFSIQAERGAMFRVPFEDVIWFKATDPIDPLGRGSSMTRAAFKEFEIDDTVRTFTNAFLRNDARPSLIVTGSKEQKIDAVDVARLEAAWLPKFKGAANNNRPMFSGVPLDIKEVGFSPREGQMIETREHAASVLAQLYSIPPEMLGRIENSNRATIDGAEDLFARFTLIPRLEMIRDILQARLMPDFIDVPFAVDTEGEPARVKPKLKGATGQPLMLRYETPVPADKLHTLNVMRGAPEAFKVNEWREEAGKVPLDGDEGEALYEAPSTGFGADGFGDGAGDGEDTGDKKPGKDGKKPGKSKKPPKGKKPKPDDDDEDKAAPMIVRKDLNAADVFNISSAHDDGEVTAELRSVFGPVYESLVAKFGEAVLQDIGSQLQFEASERLRAWASKTTANLVRDIGETTRRELRDMLIDAIDEGIKASEVAARISEKFDDFEDYRADRIARTESTRAAGYASWEAAKQAGMTRKQWLSVGDNKVRDNHQSLDGQTVGIDEPFTIDGKSALFPGDFGDPSEDVNCRCAMIPIVAGEIDPATGEVLASFDVEHTKAAHIAGLDSAEVIMRRAAVRALRIQKRAALRALAKS